METNYVCVMAPRSSFKLYLERHSVWKKPAFVKMKMQKQAFNQSDETRADVWQLFKNLFRITNRKLGSGAYGEVWMAVDIFHQRQVACKVMKSSESHQDRSGKAIGTLWREVDLLKDMSHVREIFHCRFSLTIYPAKYLAH